MLVLMIARAATLVQAFRPFLINLVSVAAAIDVTGATVPSTILLHGNQLTHTASVSIITSYVIIECTLAKNGGIHESINNSA